jgi:hypothetical protein
VFFLGGGSLIILTDLIAGDCMGQRRK